MLFKKFMVTHIFTASVFAIQWAVQHALQEHGNRTLKRSTSASFILYYLISIVRILSNSGSVCVQ